jgi:hypothetical protein
MSKVCTICTHVDRDRINHELIIGTPNRQIAAQWNLSAAALRRHKIDHLPERLREARMWHYTAETVEIKEYLTQLEQETWAILKESRDPAVKRNDIALKAIFRLEKQIELQNRLQKDKELEELMRRIEALETLRR